MYFKKLVCNQTDLTDPCDPCNSYGFVGPDDIQRIIGEEKQELKDTEKNSLQKRVLMGIAKQMYDNFREDLPIWIDVI